MLDRVGAVLFDLDNTLIDRDRAFLEWARWFARARLDLHDDQSASEAIALIVSLDASGHGPKEILFQRLRERYPALSQDMPALVAEFRDQMLAHLPNVDETTSQLLDALTLASIPWGIVTNGSSSQLLRVRQLGLAARTSCIVVSEVVGARKPDPRIFLIAATRLGVRPENILFVGDHPEKDIVGAAATGMQTAWLRQSREWPSHLAANPPDHTLDSLAELLWLAGGDETTDTVALD